MTSPLEGLPMVSLSRMARSLARGLPCEMQRPVDVCLWHHLWEVFLWHQFPAWRVASRRDLLVR
jgi:hypothetical protein